MIKAVTMVYKRFLGRMVIRIIRKHFREGLHDQWHGEGYRWSWSKEFEKEIFGKILPEIKE